MKSLSDLALILKRSNSGEADRIITVVTPSFGKISCVAKGVRKMTSTKRAFLEPGNVIKGFFVLTKSMPLLTQAQLLADTALIRADFVKVRQLMQVLEIFDRLLIEEELEATMFELLLTIRHEVSSPDKTSGRITTYLDQLVENLGYQPLAETHHASILDYISEITEKPMKSWEYLAIK